MCSAPIALIRSTSLPIWSIVPVIGILSGFEEEFEEESIKLGYVNTTIRISDGFLFVFLAVSRKVFIACSCCSNGTNPAIGIQPSAYFTIRGKVFGEYAPSSIGGCGFC